MEISVIIILGICLIASLALNGFILLILTKNHQEEKKDLHNRLMSREYPEYLHGKHTEQIIEQEAEENKRPKKDDVFSAELRKHKKVAEQY